MSLDPRSLAWATLAHKRLPQRALYTLLAELRDPQAVLDASPALLARHVPAEIAAAVRAPLPAAEIDATMRWLDDPAHHLVAWDDTDYPRALLDLGHAPPVVFLLGRRDLLNRPALAIVGSRNATPQGRATAREFARARRNGSHDRVRPRARHRRGRARRRARKRCVDGCDHRHGAGPRLSGAQSRARAAHRGYRRHHHGIRAGYATAQGELSATQPPDQRIRARRARRRGDTVVRFAHHRTLGRGARPRRVRNSRLDSFTVRTRLPQTHSRRCEARRARRQTRRRDRGGPRSSPARRPRCRAAGGIVAAWPRNPPSQRAPPRP